MPDVKLSGESVEVKFLVHLQKCKIIGIAGKTVGAWEHLIGTLSVHAKLSI